MAQIPKSRFVKGPYKPICRDCAIYFSITVLITYWIVLVTCMTHPRCETQCLRLALTLGADPKLDNTHRVLGHLGR